MPKLSILMPVYNTVAYLEQTVDSVLNQSFRDFELILINDGSTDGSADLCDALAEKDERIRVIHKENGGVASARNTGLNAAVGEYIGWVDSDDLVHPEMFETMIAVAKEHNADVVQCNHVREPEQLDADLGAIEILNNIESLKQIYRSQYTNACALWSKIYQANLFSGLRFTEGTAFEDDEMVPRLLERSRNIVYIDAKLYCYVKRESSIITAPKAENIMALTKYLEERMLWFETIENELYELARRHLFNYLKGKVCEKFFINTPVQKQAVDMLTKHKRLFWKIANVYDRVALLLLMCGGKKLVARTDFEPIQKIIRRIKG